MGIGALHHGNRRSRKRPCSRAHGLWLLVLCSILPEDPSYFELCRFQDTERREVIDPKETLKANDSIGWAVDVIDPKELSTKMLKKETNKRNKINLNEIPHDSAMGLIDRVLKLGVLLTEVYIDTVGDPGQYEMKLSKSFPSIKFVVAKKADILYPVVSGASIVAKVTRDLALREWVLDETAENMHRSYGSGYPRDPLTKSWLEHHKYSIFGFPTLVWFSWELAPLILKMALKSYGAVWVPCDDAGNNCDSPWNGGMDVAAPPVFCIITECLAV